MTIYLGIDYGREHLGLALADGPLAVPLTSLNEEPTAASPFIVQIISREGVGEVVIGLPEGKLQEEINKFGTELSRLSGLPVVYHEETLSTQDAVRLLRAGGAKKKKLMQDHVYAACLILEDYLETLGS